MGASGLATFTDALRRFATSGDRELTALREAAKRCEQDLGRARAALQARRAVVEQALAEARRQLDAAHAATDAEVAAERARLHQLDTAIGAIGLQAAADAAKRAADLRRKLRTARRRWARRGDFVALESAVADAVRRAVDANEAACRATFQAAAAESAGFGTAVPAATRPRVPLAIEPLTPEERRRRAVSGRAQWLRRSLWHRWYLPGLAAFDRTTIANEVAAQAAWFSEVATAARTAATNVLAERLDVITRRGAAEFDRIRHATNFTANETEAAQLARDIPTAEAQLAVVTEIHHESRALAAQAAP
jgi:hypothetical protein